MDLRRKAGEIDNQKTLIMEILMGSLIYNLILMGLAILFYPNISVLLGLFVGMISTSIMLLHIAVTVDEAMKKESAAEAEKRILKAVFLRKGLFVFFYLAVLLWFTPWVDPIAVIIGALGMKAGIYLRPVSQRLQRHA